MVSINPSLLIACSAIFNSILSTHAYALEIEHIVGGDPSSIRQFPYHVSIEVFGISSCGGGIIDERHVITAAHCIIDRQTQYFQEYRYKVVGGTLNVGRKDATQQSASVEKMFVLKRYAEQRRKLGVAGDIAVLRLREPLNLEGNPYLGKLELPDPGDTFANEVAIVTGYGYTWMYFERNKTTGKIMELDGGTFDKLYYAKTRVLSRDSCQQNYRWMISEDHLCARVKQRNPIAPAGVCDGDSGGPLVYDNRVLIGVVSSSPAGCQENIAAGIYTRVSSFLDFIHKALKDEDDPEIMTKTIKEESLYYDY